MSNEELGMLREKFVSKRELTPAFAAGTAWEFD
jgi:hypothetical protein